MSYFTERHGMRKAIENTSIITIEMYALLFDCCEKYYDNLAWKFPEQCPDGNGICGLNFEQLRNNLKYEIPELYQGSDGNIAVPGRNYYDRDLKNYDQYALLDFVEFFAQNVRDISSRSWHSFFRHDELSFSKTWLVFNEFCKEINQIFEKTGLLFALTEGKIVERVIENSILTHEIINAVEEVKELGTKELLEEAITLFKQPNPSMRKTAIEKIWDALERLKTYYTTLDKRNSVGKIINDISNGQVEFIKVFDDEFAALTKIGNDFRIRHHETDKIDITDDRHYDYFFNRCLSLISLAIHYLR
jgi:hypothetical protein